MLFAESEGAGSDGGTTRAPGNEERRVGGLWPEGRGAPVSCGQGTLEVGGRGAMGARCECGVGRTTSNRVG